MSASPVRLLWVGDRPAELIGPLREAMDAGGAPRCVIDALPGVADVRGAVDRSSYEALLVDLPTPDPELVDGVLQTLEVAAGIPVLVLAGRDDEEVALRLLAAGAQDVLAREAVDGPGLARAVRYAMARARVERGNRLLIDAGRVLASTLDYESTLRSLAEVAVPELADWCSIDVMDEEGRLRVVEFAAADARRGRLLRALLCGHARGRGDPEHPVGQVLRSGESRLYAELPPGLLGTPTRGRHRTARRLDARAAMLVPMTAHGRVLGVITLVATGAERRFDARSLELAEELARQAALEVENARLYRSAQTAQFCAERNARVRDEVLGFVAHDLRNPLSAASMYVSLLLNAPLPTAAREQVRAIRECTVRMDHLIDDLLDVTRIEAERLRVVPCPVPVSTLLGDVRTLMEPLAEAAGVHLEQELCDELPPVLADRKRIQQVFSNLVGNALKFTPAGGRITVRGEAAEAGVRFSVIDTGTGIATEDLAHVFERFWQAGDATQAGAGLGLTIVKGIVEAHGGHVRVESEPGRGSTFHFVLPALAASGALPDAGGEPQPRRATLPAGPIRVLVVDDHPVVRRGLEKLLRPTPHIQVVGHAGNGEEAVEKTRELRPHVVLMDLSMPGMGGIEAIRRIRATGGDVHVLALTADSEEESLLGVLEAGGNGYVRKTAAPADLRAAIECVARDEVFLYPSGSRLLLQSYQQMRKTAKEDALHALNEREREILTLTAAGFTSAEIGRKLCLAASTIDTHRSTLMRRLGLGHRSELVRFAVRTGLLRAETPVGDLFPAG